MEATMKRYNLLSIFSLFILYQTVIDGLYSSPVTQNNYTVTDDNITCVVMTTAMQLTIPYHGQNKSLTATVNITDDFSVTGTCSNSLGQNTLNISFNDVWSLVINFKNTSGSSYEWSNVMLTYVLDEVNFPNVSSTIVNKTVEVDTELPEGTDKAQLSGSYSCQGSSVLNLNNSLVLTLTDLQYRAFGNDNYTWFTGTNVHNCNGATTIPETPIGVTVAVGIAVGSLMVVVIVLYLMADKLLGRRKLSYD